jgi:hypothetical protein
MTKEKQEELCNHIRKKLYTWIRTHGGRRPEWIIMDTGTVHIIKPYKNERGVSPYIQIYGEIPRFDGYKVAAVNVVDKEIIEWR